MSPPSIASEFELGWMKIAAAIPTYKSKEMLTRLIGNILKDRHIYVSDNESSLLPLDPPSH